MGRPHPAPSPMSLALGSRPRSRQSRARRPQGLSFLICPASGGALPSVARITATSCATRQPPPCIDSPTPPHPGPACPAPACLGHTLSSPPLLPPFSLPASTLIVPVSPLSPTLLAYAASALAPAHVVDPLTSVPLHTGCSPLAPRRVVVMARRRMPGTHLRHRPFRYVGAATCQRQPGPAGQPFCPGQPKSRLPGAPLTTPACVVRR